MATLVLSAVGASVGGAIGGSAFGLSSVVIGRAVGATLGRVIDQRLLGLGSEAVPSGKVERFHLNGAGEGNAIGKSFGRVRISGQVIWASRFKEEIITTGGSGKGGGGSSSADQEYGYSVSLAIALGEGVVTRIGRIWADGVEVSRDDFNYRFYPGSDTQLPDAKIEAVEGAGLSPAFRGTAYVMFEDLPLGRFGNRVPQFSFEVFRRAQPSEGTSDPGENLRGVALIPGTGEYALATTPVHYDHGLGVNRSANVNTASGKSDLETSLQALREEMPNCKAVSLVVSWFGDDLRCNHCTLRPKVDQAEFDGVGMPWMVSSTLRTTAALVSQGEDARPAFGGTPADLAVIEAIAEINAGGQEVMFYPFILMDVPAANSLPDPWSGAAAQPIYPWRGRITTSVAPGEAGSSDQTAAASAEVSAFFGTSQPSDFTATSSGVAYSGPSEWSYRRFILHCAHLCAVAGGVESFCIGSEMRSLGQIRGPNGEFPAIAAMQALAADVRAVLGPDVKIGYAADWSEYFGYHPQDGTGDVFFHLDPLWADPNIDFIGIDNYMPISDWRDGEDHLDAHFGSIYASEYLSGNVAGGEGFDWYYASDPARDHQIRTPITDGAYGEDWVFRYKDIANWWSKPHHNRIGGVRQANATEWMPESKQIRFTELGCAAVDKGTNRPNVFVDPKSSESSLPRYSNGLRDDVLQSQYYRTLLAYWQNEANNPISEVYAGQMIDMDHLYGWAWDSRPWPAFPMNLELWSDGKNYPGGHWINGRLGDQSLADVTAELCENAGVTDYDVSALYGNVTGFQINDLQSARASLQTLMLGYGIDAVEEGGVMRFFNRSGRADATLDYADLVFTGDALSAVQKTRLPEAEMPGKIQLDYVQSNGSYETGAAEFIFADTAARSVSRTALPLVLSPAEGQGVVERWSSESRAARELVSFALPASEISVSAGDVLTLPVEMGGGLVRVDRLEETGTRRIDAVRVDPSVYQPLVDTEQDGLTTAFVPPVPVFPMFMDLPMLTGQEVEHAPHMAVTATPWPGSVALFSAPEDEGYALNSLIERSSVIGQTETSLVEAMPSRWSFQVGLRVKVFGGALSSASPDAVLNGANVAAIGDGSADNWEIIQFCDADLVAPDTFELGRLLRGQAGSEGRIPGSWPVGSYFVLLNGLPKQIDLAVSARDLARHYRIGPANRPFSDGSFQHRVIAFAGNGLKPFAPCHLRARFENGDSDIRWIRRTRVDGDSWRGLDVPLGETVMLDQQSVGRLSRMDAMQQQAMAQAIEQRRVHEFLRLNAALKRIEQNEFGDCLDCGEEIAAKRLDHDPTIPRCISCTRGL